MTGSKRIAMVVSNRYEPDPRVHKEAVALRQAGYEVRVFAFDRQHDSIPEELVDGVVVTRIRARRTPLGGSIATALGLRAFLDAVREPIAAFRPHAVHCHDQDTCPVGLWWRRRSGRLAARFVFDAHDLYWTWLRMPDPDSRVRRLGATALALRDRVYATRADLLITVTEGAGQHPGTAEVYRGWGLAPLVVWNAPPPVQTAPPLPERFTVGYLGNVRELRMFEWLLDAIGRLDPSDRPDLRIAGAGRAAGDVATLVEDRSAALDIRAQITGGFTHADLPVLHAECSLQYCVYPTGRGNIERAMPVKLLESVAHGRRVIGNDGSLMGDWIVAHDWGWAIREGDVAGLAAALAKARSRAGDALSPEAVPTWDQQAGALVEAYRSLLGGL